MTDTERMVVCKESFPIGVVCKLRSGGPAMTVSQWREDDIVDTEWFDGNALVRDAFHPFELVLP